jgi:hypothetical protein
MNFRTKIQEEPLSAYSYSIYKGIDRLPLMHIIPSMNKSHLTAMTRKTLSAPMVWLDRQEAFTDHPPHKVLDYGCGKGSDADHFEFDKYDPFYFPTFPTKKYEIITCNYVLNVLPDAADRQKVIDNIIGLLESYGWAYFTVRSDTKELKGLTKRGTYQGYHPPVHPNIEKFHKTSGYEIYYLINK